MLQKPPNIVYNSYKSVTDMELEDSSGAHRLVLRMQLNFFCLTVLWLQGTAAQGVDTGWEAQLPAFCVGFKVHHQGLKGAEWRGGWKDA